MNQKGFGILVIMFVTVGILIAGGTVWYISQNNPQISQNTIQVDQPNKQPPQKQEQAPTQPTPVSVKDDVSELVLTPGKTFLLKDGLTEISLRQVHQSASMKGGFLVENGLPYVKVGNGWLEIVNSATVANNDYVFQIDKVSCDIQSKFRVDYTYGSLESCKVRVKTSKDNVPVITIRSFQKNISLNDSDDKLFSTIESGQLIAVRSLGFNIGNVNRDTKPWVVETISSGLDVVTNFGVANIDFDYNVKPVIGSVKTFSLGRQRITVKVLDVANVHTSCPSCRTTFDLSISVEPSTSADSQVRILKYN